MKSLHSQENEKLTAWLRSERERIGMTMRDAAKLLGKSHSYVGKTETSERRLDVVEFVWYCQALGFNPIEGLKLIIKDS